MQFDARAAKLLTPGAHIMVDGCQGLRLEASASKRSWIYRFKSPVDGRMRQKKIGEWPAVSLAKAAVAWEALRDQRNAGTDPVLETRATAAAKAAPASRGYTIRQLCDDYLNGHIKKHRKAKGAKEVERLFTKRLDAIAHKQAATLTRADAFDLLEKQSGTPVSTASLRGELAGAWDHALDAGRLPDSSPNWWRLIMRGRLRSKGRKIEGKYVGTAKRSLSQAETGELIRWLPNFSRTIDDAMTLYLWTCTRGAEICAVAADEITEEDDGLWWTIPKAKTKNARHKDATDMRVPLVGRAAVVVRRRLQDAGKKGYLFPADTELGHTEQKVFQTGVHYKQPYSKTNPKEVRTRLPVSHWAPHDLRRTSRTLLASMGCPDAVGEAILGHMLPGMIGVYNTYEYDKERRHWLAALDVKLEQLASTR
ncbi:tyrosine-type recombinase/integrase [Variovorax sp. W2I14]|uniref:tyrosine-type recombinase/integrase n=1 Tax=Variovorax sp. W2I14 TaxID=3042290 RepID=UPI003D262BE0